MDAATGAAETGVGAGQSKGERFRETLLYEDANHCGGEYVWFASYLLSSLSSMTVTSGAKDTLDMSVE